MGIKYNKILKTCVALDDGIYLLDTIEYEGKLWLVPEWIDDTPTKGYSKPARIICLTFLPHSGPTDDPLCDYNYVLHGDPIPKSVFEGHAPPELAKLYVVIENPDIVVETPTAPVFH